MNARLVIASLVLVVSPTALADVLTLEPSADNTLYERPNGDRSNGSGVRMFAGRTEQDADEDLRRALIRFDVSSVPSGSVITSVSLQLHCSRSISE